MNNKISLIVATKDRPHDLRRLLESLSRQSAPPDDIVVVDASQQPVEPVVCEFSGLAIRYLRHWPPSASAQRNAGIQACDSSSTLIGFADDDTTFEPDAFAHMLDFWRAAGPEVLGASFNLRNYPPRGRSFLKHSKLVEWLGLYSPQPGSVSRSGWQTVSGELKETQFVEWVSSTAVLFRREVFNETLFDEAFESYSYLEDLDLSYTISRMGRLAVVANAGFFHYPSTAGRVSARRFGRYEVRNRLYFVRKHNLSVGRCYLGLAVRWTMSVCAGLANPKAGALIRALGNVEGLWMRVATVPNQSHKVRANL